MRNRDSRTGGPDRRSCEILSNTAGNAAAHYAIDGNLDSSARLDTEVHSGSGIVDAAGLIVTQTSCSPPTMRPGAARASRFRTGSVRSTGHDAASQLIALTYKLGTTTLGTLTYGYDAAGRRTDVGGTWARTSLPETDRDGDVRRGESAAEFRQPDTRV